MSKFPNKLTYNLRKPFKYKQWNVVYILMGINVGVYLLSMLMNSISGPGSISQILGLSFVGVIGERGYYGIWQFITYMFVHDTSSIFHILFNMFALYMFGKPLENRLGSIEFLVYYLVSGVAAGLLHFGLQGIAFGVYTSTGSENALIINSAIPLIGASGAVFAIMLAYGVFFAESMIYLFGVLPLKAKNAVLLFGAIELFNLFSSGNSNVSNLTHIGGLLAGIIYLKVRKNINSFKVLFPKRR